MSRVVLDASALLALLNAEPGSEEVEGAIPGAAISTVNFSEVVAKLRRSPEVTHLCSVEVIHLRIRERVA